MSFDPSRPAGLEPLTPAAPESSPDTGPALAVPTAPVVASSPIAASPAATRTSRTGRSGRWLNLVLVLAAAVAIGGVAFAVGRSTAPVSAATGNGRGAFIGRAPGASFQPGGNGQQGRGGFGGGLTVRGTVESVNGTTLTIKTATGQTIEVTTGASTTYHTQTPASASDVQAGKTVEVQLDFGGAGRPTASATTTAPIGTAGSVTVIP